MTIRRNQWQNEDIIRIVQHLKLDGSYEHYNYAIDQVANIFQRFEEHFTQPSALAYMVDEDSIVCVGPQKYETKS